MSTLHNNAVAWLRKIGLTPDQREPESKPLIAKHKQQIELFVRDNPDQVIKVLIKEGFFLWRDLRFPYHAPEGRKDWFIDFVRHGKQEVTLHPHKKGSKLVLVQRY